MIVLTHQLFSCFADKRLVAVRLLQERNAMAAGQKGIRVKGKKKKGFSRGKETMHEAFGKMGV